jgi:hypothetical protein
MAMEYSKVFDPRTAGEREVQHYQVALETAFGIPFADLVERAARETGATRIDLLRMGRQIFFDTVRVARGELSSVHIPGRMPRHGEYNTIH